MRNNSTDSSYRDGFNTDEFSYAVGTTVGIIIFMLVIFFVYYRCIRSVPQQLTPQHTPRVDIISEPSSSRESGVEEAVIHSYPIIVFSEKHEALSQQQQDRSCSICLEDYKCNEQLRMIMDCRHVYHVHCIDAWLTGHASCPICRKSPHRELVVRAT
ncbi:hypothetical protein SUGI_1027400 [Cryptomeria japonica]|uniref:RING-H2 finger protein ATL67-like n=1 Tax=Cryptomeria japonica TaxID=3369 RepID=UPI0024148C84|nr:RING-H2 finger protein ATL67-like [Cryptomeria japonica]GLJ48718.1 hypothetical protein SUGI_1027400 [Cryptomeria japonica]